jgi:hypothetical protein
MMMEFLPNTQPKRRPPEPLVDPVNKLMLFWMHRCGSTTGQLWFFETVGWGDRIKGKGASGLTPEWLEQHADVYKDLTPYYNDPSFLKVVVVRNPLSRTVSAFSVVTDTKSGAQWRAVARSLKEPDAENRLTFPEFLDFLESHDLAAANYHWRIQTASHWHELALPNVHVARLESLQADLGRISEMLGKPPIAMKKSSATTKVEADLSKIDVNGLRRPDFDRIFGKDRRGIIQFPDYRHFINASTAARIAKLYAQDFQVLGYPISNRA